MQPEHEERRAGDGNWERLGDVATRVVQASRHGRSLTADLSFRRQVEALHRLGPRVTGELIAELAHRHGSEVRDTMARFAALDPAVLAALDALLWPPIPLHFVG